MGRPILFDKENDLYVRQPTIGEIVDLGEDGFNQLIMPMTLTNESVFGGLEKEEELKAEFHIYDLYFAQIEENVFVLDSVFGGKSALGVLKESLSYFLQTDDIEFLIHRKKIVINSNFLLDKKGFMNLRTIIQGITNKSDIEVDKPPKNMTEKQKDIWAKLQKGRRRKAEKDATYLQDLIGYVSFGGTTYIPLDHIEKMTYYQFSNAYKSIMGVDAFRTGMSYKLSQKFDVKDEIKHWTESLKIGK